MATLESAKSKYASDAVHTMSPGRIIVALYDRVLLDLERAIAAVETSDIYGAHTALIHAQEIIGELLVALDLKLWPAGASLAALYRYISGELVVANVNKDAERIRACHELVVPLRDAWREASGIVASVGPDVA